MWNTNCKVCEEKDRLIDELRQELFTVRTEKNKLLDVVLGTRAQPVSENNEPIEDPIPNRRMNWPKKRRELEQADRERAQELRAEAEARRQMAELIAEAQELPEIKETENAS